MSKKHSKRTKRTKGGREEVETSEQATAKVMRKIRQLK